jgi:GST-like protein
MIDLYYWPTPNGKKVSILLEECAMEYRVVPCNIGKGDLFEDFTQLAPDEIERRRSLLYNQRARPAPE